MEDIAPEIEKEWKRRWDSKTTNEDWENKDKWTKILTKEMTKLKWRVFLTMRCFSSYQNDREIAQKLKRIVVLYMYLHSTSQEEKEKFVEASVKKMPKDIIYLFKGEIIRYKGFWLYPEDFTILRKCITKALKSDYDKWEKICG